MAYPDNTPYEPELDVKFNLTDIQNDRISCFPDADTTFIFQQIALL